jgi:hypothetical protein
MFMFIISALSRRNKRRAVNINTSPKQICGEDGTFSGLCPMAGFCAGGTKPSGYTITDFLFLLYTSQFQITECTKIL